MRTAIASLLFCLAFVLSSCDLGVSSPRGFSLPKGDVEKGEAVFLTYRCLSCHTMAGYEDDTAVHLMKNRVTIGGKRSQTTTYAFLVTSVINPSHKIAAPKAQYVDADEKSKMPTVNDTLTITELIDLVSFLETQYEVEPYQYTPYSYYPIN